METTKFDERRIDRIIKKAGGLIGKAKTQDTCDTLYKRRVSKTLTDIIDDASHPLHDGIVCQKIVRSGRFRIPRVKTERYKNSFVPSALKLFNNAHGRNRLSN